MPAISYSQLLEVAGGRWLVVPDGASAVSCRCVCDDSRILKGGELFVAIIGELSDGHRYVSKAVAAGAAGIVVQDAPAAEVIAQAASAHCPVLQVADSLAAYQQLALWHRHQFPAVKVVAITGSCGKTSTKEMCASILEQRWPGGVLKTIGSTNNHFGVPRNLYRIDENTRVAVIEMGTNHNGEISRLVSLAPPDVGVVCNIGHAHLEAFHDLRGVAREKGTLLKGIRPGGIAVYPSDAEGNDILDADAAGHDVIAFGKGADAEIVYEYLGYHDGAFHLRLAWRLTGCSREVCWHIGGQHMAANAAAAAAAATALGLTPDEVVAGLERCVLPGQRLEVREANGVRWVNDAFNANPDSMRAAIDWMAEVAGDAPKTLLLGDMLELGDDSARSHREILEYALAKCPDAAIMTVGKLMGTAVTERSAGASLGNVADAAAASEWLAKQSLEGGWVLLKSSHSIGLAALGPK